MNERNEEFPRNIKFVICLNYEGLKPKIPGRS